MNNSKLVCGVIVTYNCKEEFLDTFSAIYSQVSKLVIVDNGSKEETLCILSNLANEYQIELISLSQNLGIAEALNRGITYALENQYEWVITFDHDSIPKENMVYELLKGYNSLDVLEKEKVVSLIPINLEQGINEEENDTQDQHVKYVERGITSGNLVKSKVFEIIGLFEAKLFIDLVDLDFCFRLIENGYKIVEVNTAILYHRLGDSSQAKIFFKNITYTNHSPLRRYYMTRNRIYCWNRYATVVPKSIREDKISAIKEIIKIMLYENEKKAKFSMIYQGYKDGKNNLFGPFRQR